MAISSFVLFTILGSATVAFGSLIFSIVMIWNFIKKRTMGTALLAIFYGLIAIYHIIHSLMLTTASLNPFSVLHKALFIAYVGTLSLSYYSLYIFACRHILPDNDIVKSTILVVMLGVNAATLGMISYELFVNVANPILYEISVRPDISHYIPNPIITIILYLTTVLFAEVRLMLRISISLIKKEIEEKIQKKGLQFILFGIISLFLSTLLTIVISLPNISNPVFIMLYVVRGLFTLFGLFLSYLGWILPNWFVRRIRKAWIVTKVKIGEEVKTSFISSKTFRKEEKQVVSEINEP